MIQRKKSLRQYSLEKKLREGKPLFTPRQTLPSTHQSAVQRPPWTKRQEEPRPARKAGLKSVSSKRAKENRIYTERRKAFLIANPTCDAHHALVALDSCAPATEVHHMAGRGKNFLNEDTWLPVCQGCHLTIHAHPNTARELGFIAPRGA